MFFRPRHIELSRRVAGYHVLFCAASVVWFAVSGLIVCRLALQTQRENACLGKLQRESSRMTLVYLRNGEASLQPLVEQAAREDGLAYCAAVAPDGRILAHSLPAKVGTTYVEPAADYERWGDVERLRFAEADSQRDMVEYRIALGSGRDDRPTMHMAAYEPALGNLLGLRAWNLPLVFLGPVLAMGLGIVVLDRAVRPVAAIEAELSAAAAAVCPSEMDLRSVGASGAATFGWNRLVEVHQRMRRQSPLDERVRRAVEPLLARQGLEVLNSLPDGIAVTDHEGCITFVNEPFSAICGNGGLEGKTIEQSLHLRGKKAAEPLLEAAARNRAVVASIEHSVDGSPRLLRIARHPLRSEESRTHGGHVWSVRDVTQQQLASQMRDQFLQTATHELRTPLANIKAYAETLSLAEHLEVERQKEFCNTINSEATRLARLIDDLLNISSMEVGSLLLSRQETDAGRLLTEVVGKVKPQMDQKRIRLETSFPEKWPKIHLDKDKIATSLVNVLGNAAKYTPAGGRVAMRVAVNQDKLVISVQDSGIGISPHELSKVFDKFFRSADPRVQEQTGSGIGLSLVKEVIRMHGGSIDLKSELNSGTECTITLPLL